MDIIQSLLNQQEFKSQVNYAIVKTPPNETILSEGSMYSYFYVIKKGKVRVKIRGEAGEGAFIHPGIADLGPGNTFGEVGLFVDISACADVVTITETELIEIEIQSFRCFIEAHKDIGYNILEEMLKIFIKRMMDSNAKILHLLEWGIKARNIDKYLK